MDEKTINLLALAAVEAFNNLSLEAKIVSIRYAMEQGEITPEKLGQVLQDLLEQTPQKASTAQVNSLLELFKAEQ